ncbi:MAG TPA: cytochrome c biogenesis protein CcdA [Halanaerobiales bacterium]|nr:cytochrome c biogenesis protein CcdA [Halanaerobiales bacterium]
MTGDLSFAIAFSAGLLSFLSPCVLPLIPSYLAFLLGDYSDQKKDDKQYSILPALLFIAGFTIIFILLGLSATFLGRFLMKNQAIIRKISGVVIIIFGLHISGIIKLKWLYYEKKLNITKKSNKYLQSFILGVGIALAWTPCIGPILSSILILAGNSQNLMTGGFLLLIYSFGFALPFLITALAAKKVLPAIKKMNKYLNYINMVSGALIIILGILVFTNNLNIIGF